MFLSACAGVAPRIQEPAARAPESSRQQALAQDIVMYSLSLIDTGYRFGGKNPEAGLDCSGMVSYVFSQAAGLKLQGSAADIARKGSAVPLSQLRPGDLVFFNTRNKPYSHVGIYIGEDRFAHAPSTGGKVRLDSLKKGWYASRLEEARAYFE
jgi:cell wall-associated NlpC family hydrolase